MKLKKTYRMLGFASLLLLFGNQLFFLITSGQPLDIYYLIYLCVNLLIFIFILTLLIISLSPSFVQMVASYDNKDIEKIENLALTESQKEAIKKQQEDDDLKFEKINKLIKGLDHQLNLKELTERLLINISKEYELAQGLAFTKDKSEQTYSLSGTYAYFGSIDRSFEYGDGISGQVAKNKEALHLTNLPDGYITIVSGLGSSTPKNLYIMPVVYGTETIAVLELASFTTIPKEFEEILKLTNKHLAELINKLQSDIVTT